MKIEEVLCDPGSGRDMWSAHFRKRLEHWGGKQDTLSYDKFYDVLEQSKYGPIRHGVFGTRV